jgi:UDP-glucose 4-epimerase
LSPTNDPAETAKVLSGVETVIHLSGANELRSATDPDAAVFETGTGARRLLEAAVRAGVRRFVYLSTIHVYGSSLEGRVSESSRARPTHPYAITHRLAEDFVLAAHEAGRIEAAVVRLSNAIGAPAWPEVDRWSLLGNDLARQAVAGGKLILKAPGQQRDFIPLSDVCDALALLVDAERGALSDGLFNLGGGRTRTVAEVAKLTAAAAERRLGTPVQLSLTNTAEGSEAGFEYVIDRFRALGFEPSAEAGLIRELEDTVGLLLETRPDLRALERTGAGP